MLKVRTVRFGRRRCVRLRCIDLLAAIAWAASLSLMAADALYDDGIHAKWETQTELGRWGVYLGMIAASATVVAWVGRALYAVNRAFEAGTQLGAVRGPVDLGEACRVIGGEPLAPVLELPVPRVPHGVG